MSRSRVRRAQRKRLEQQTGEVVQMPHRTKGKSYRGYYTKRVKPEEIFAIAEEIFGHPRFYSSERTVDDQTRDD